MANPRQRRKARSSTHKAVSQSRRAKKNLKKQPPIKAPKALQDAWDKKKTLKQNYAAIGILHTTAPSSKPPLPTSTSSVVEQPETTRQATESGKLPAGLGRIIRDEEGNIVDVELGGEEEKGPVTSTPWGEPMEEWKDKDFIGEETVAKTDVVRALEEAARSRGEGGKRVQTASMHEEKWLRRLVEKHGRDVSKMARDRRENVWQRTEGQLRRAIAKAGGFEKLEIEGLESNV